MEPLTHFLELVTKVIDLFGVAIILYGFALSATGLLIAEFGRFRGGNGLPDYPMVRINLGTYFLTGIEVMIASDIVATVLSRATEDLIFVSALVVIRTVISFFLGREINELKASHEGKLQIAR